MILNSSGAVDSYNNYYPFGMQMPGSSPQMNLTGSADGRYKFTGKEQDPETSLYYFGARYYNSWSGRWNSVDPLANKYPGWSPYNYVEDNPAGSVDPNGMSWYRNGSGAITYNADVNSQQYLNQHHISGTFLGAQYWTANKQGNLTFYNANGSRTAGEFSAPKVTAAAAGVPGSPSANLFAGALVAEGDISFAVTYDELAGRLSGYLGGLSGDIQSGSQAFENFGTGLSILDAGISVIQFSSALGNRNVSGEIQAGGSGVVAGASLTLTATVGGPFGAALGVGYTIGQFPVFQNLGRQLAPYSQPIYNWMTGTK